MNKKRIVFITGTRADYGKIKSLIKVLDNDEKFEVFVFVCGMHLLEKFGSTYEEVLKDGYKKIYIAYGLLPTHNTSINIGNTIVHLSGYVENIKPDMIIVHGDRIEALAGAVVGALHNILVAHIEGGEISGTIDESIRHAVSKFSHLHFVCNEEAKKRLIQLGENKEQIYVIGSPDIDVMLSSNLPAIDYVKNHYNIPYNKYAILMYHSVTTEYYKLGINIKTVVDAVIASDQNYIVVYPNNDLGFEIILNEYQRFKGVERVKIFPSLRFEYFLTLLKNAEFIIGNSSAGVREAGIYGLPAIDVGTRQSGRYDLKTTKNVQHVTENAKDILNAINNVNFYRMKEYLFGEGNSTEKFYSIMSSIDFSKINIQKKFVDFRM